MADISTSNVPIIATAISAAVALVVALITTQLSARTESRKLRLGVQQKLLEQLVEARLATYPDFYALISDLLKEDHRKPSSPEKLKPLLDQVNVWDSKNAILLGPNTTEVCNQFRTCLAETIADATNPQTIEVLHRHAEKLELGLRSDLGIYGIDFSKAKDDLVTRQVSNYFFGDSTSR